MIWTERLYQSRWTDESFRIYEAKANQKHCSYRIEERENCFYCYKIFKIWDSEIAFTETLDEAKNWCETFEK